MFDLLFAPDCAQVDIKPYEKAYQLSELMKATAQCARGVRWKTSVYNYEDKSILKNHTLGEEIRLKKYKISPYVTFKVCEPKVRTINATRIRDRVWQRSMSNNGVYADMTRGLIYDNTACQEGKGVDFAVNRLVEQLHRYYRKYHTNKGWGAHLDIHHYFPETSHAEAKETMTHRIHDLDFLQHAKNIVDSFAVKDQPDDIGIHLGSSLSQLIQVANPDRIDHHLKEHMHPDVYGRYMDDFILATAEKAHMTECVNYVEGALNKKGLSLNVKSSVFPLEQGIVFLQLHFYLTATGKVIIRLDRKNITHERKKLRKLKVLQAEGRVTMEDIAHQYMSWEAHVASVNSYGAVKQMAEYYYSLFGVKPPQRAKRKRVKNEICNG